MSSIRSSPSGRCVIRSTVASAAASTTSSISRCAVGGSRCAVGSSSISTGAPAEQRAREHEALSLAARELAPVLADERVEAVGERAAPTPSSWARPRASAIASSVASGRPRPTFSRMLAENTCASWPATAIARADVLLAVRAQVAAAQRHAALSGSRKRSSRCAIVVLPAPLGPSRATLRPGSSRRATPSSARLLVARVPRRATFSSAIVNGRRGDGAGSAGSVIARLAVDQLEHPLAGRHASRTAPARPAGSGCTPRTTASASSASIAMSDAVEPARGVGVDGDREHAGRRQARRRGAGARRRRRRRARRGAPRARARVGGAHAGQAARPPAVDGELRRRRAAARPARP